MVNTQDAWAAGLAFPGRTRNTIAIKRDISQWGGSSIDLMIDKEHYHINNNAYIKRNTPILYSCYLAADGTLGVVVHCLDFTTIRRRATNQVDVQFLVQVQFA